MGEPVILATMTTVRLAIDLVFRTRLRIALLLFVGGSTEWFLVCLLLLCLAARSCSISTRLSAR